MEKRFSFFIERGIKDNRLISNPIQIPNQEEEEMEISVPKIKVKKKSNLKEFFKI